MFCWALELAMLSKEASFIRSFVLNFSTFDLVNRAKVSSSSGVFLVIALFVVSSSRK